MVLDILQSRQRQIALRDRYGELLTEHQRTVLDLRLRQDWSLSEIAEHQQTSRAAVHDLLRRAGLALEDYEARLGLLAEQRHRHQVIGAITRELALLRRRLERLESEMARA